MMQQPSVPLGRGMVYPVRGRAAAHPRQPIDYSGGVQTGPDILATGVAVRPSFLIVGTGRCGSTLLQAMLMSHPRIRVPPETQYFQFMDPVALGHPDPLGDADVGPYLRDLEALHGWRILRAGGLEARYAEAVRGGLRSARDQFNWVCDRLSADQSGDLLGEKTPQHWSYLERILSLEPHLKVIHIHRDPRDVVAGLMTMRWWKGRSIRRTARYWRKALLAAESWQKRLGPNQHRIVRYETLVEHPETVLRDLAGFLDLEFDPAMLDQRRAAGTAFRPGEDDHKGLTRQAVTTERCGRYRRTLSPFQVRVVEGAAGRGLMARHGYEPDPQVPRPAWSVLDPAAARIGENLGLPAACRVRG